MLEGDLGSVQNQKLLADGIRERKFYHVHLAPDCSSFSALSNLNGSTRAEANHYVGDGSKPAEVAGNEGMAIACWLILLCIIYGVSFGFEHPLRAKSMKLNFFVWLMGLAGYIFVFQYRHGGRVG